MALKTVEQFVEWAPLGQHLTPSLISVIFEFAAFRSLQMTSSTDCKPSESSLAAVDCATNILTKKCIPREFEAFILELTSSLMQVLQRLTSHGSSMEKAGEDYLDKITSFLDVFFENHVARLEKTRNFALDEFLHLLFTYTCQQPHSVGFVNCILLWDNFVHYINESNDNIGGNSLLTYTNGLQMLSSHLLGRITFASNAIQLEELDDISDNNNVKENSILDSEEDQVDAFSDSKESGLSEMEEFMNDCISLIVGVADVGDSFYVLIYMIFFI